MSVRMRGGLRLLAILALAAVASAGQAMAETALTLVNGSQTLDLSADDLAAMPQTTIKTENEFVDGTVTYVGPLVRDVLARVGLDKVDNVRFVAANDYYVDVPTQNFRDYGAILAVQADGERLSRRDKGPVWLMYPISDYPELHDPIYSRRLIWQVVKITSE
ncbi:MAG: molybdopterin-dependent oxidoreductase [Amaricoccus sp.]|uniref:molybdopterin-dependent oxidoreductase n=1 Tax=Amaricoccus sp. TaxID=1872485 RepID=UPI0039E3422E